MLDFFIHPRNTEHLLFASFKRRTSEQDNHEQNTSPFLMKVTVLYDEIENRQFCRSRAMKVSPTQLDVSYFMQKVRECLLVPYCCCNKLPQTQWCKPTHIYYLTVLEVRSLKQISSRCSEENPFLPFAASRGHQHPLALGLFILIQSQQLSIVALPPLPLTPISYKDLMIIWPTQMVQDKLPIPILLITTANSILPHKVTNLQDQDIDILGQWQGGGFLPTMVGFSNKVALEL